jgi:PAS domain-containing protein
MFKAFTSLATEHDLLLAVVASAAVLILGAMLFRTFAGRRNGNKSRLLATALNNMTQGVVMFDDRERIVICNDQYLEMYNLSPEVVKPGCTLRDLIQHRIDRGSLMRNADEYRRNLVTAMAEGRTLNTIVETPDGHSISVVNKPIPGGKYWVGP